AAMVKYGVVQCPRVANPSSFPPGRTTQLAVVLSPLGVFGTPSEIPAVARWEWDAARKVQYIGLRCGIDWCNIGPASPGGAALFTPADPYIAPPTTGAPMAADRVRAVKGWYDQQRLALIP